MLVNQAKCLWFTCGILFTLKYIWSNEYPLLCLKVRSLLRCFTISYLIMTFSVSLVFGSACCPYLDPTNNIPSIFTLLIMYFWVTTTIIMAIVVLGLRGESMSLDISASMKNNSFLLITFIVAAGSHHCYDHWLCFIMASHSLCCPSKSRIGSLQSTAYSSSPAPSPQSPFHFTSLQFDSSIHQPISLLPIVTSSPLFPTSATSVPSHHSFTSAHLMVIPL